MTDPQWLIDYESTEALHPGPMGVTGLFRALADSGQHLRWREAYDDAVASQKDAMTHARQLIRAGQWVDKLAAFQALTDSMERAKRMTSAASSLAAVSLMEDEAEADARI